MRQREHLDEATAACWVTFCAEAIRTKVLIVAQHPTAPATATWSNGSTWTSLPQPEPATLDGKPILS